MSQLTLEQALESAFQHHQAGRLAQAEHLYRQILAHHPRHFDTLHFLGILAAQAGRYESAVEFVRQALEINPRSSHALRNLAKALKDCGQLEQAIATYHQAINLKNDSPEAWCNLGVALRANGQLDESIAAYQQAISLSPALPEAHYNLGNSLKDSRQFDRAIAAYERAISLRPNYPDARYNLATALLVTGDFERGWREYEWRLKSRLALRTPRNFTKPAWDGTTLAGTLLLHAEQGFGDTIQFIRYLPLLKERVAGVIVECEPALARLFEATYPEFRIVPQGKPIPPFEMHCALLSLPYLFKTTLETIPAQKSYLSAPADEVRKWRNRLTGDGNARNVGLCWAGNKAHGNDRNRSIAMSAFAPLAQIPGIRFVSLQKSESAAERLVPPPGLQLLDFTSELSDFAATAALIANLDLVISVDTSVAHLSGAMGKPTWLLLPFAPDWRWLLERDDSPWYPTMRLFRQPVAGNWKSVIDRVTAGLTGASG